MNSDENELKTQVGNYECHDIVYDTIKLVYIIALYPILY